MSAVPKLPHPAPANDAPQLRTFDALVAEFGFGSTRALRDWCRRRRVPYTRDGGYNWADRNLIVAAIARGPQVVVPAAPSSPSVARWFDATMGGAKHGT